MIFVMNVMIKDYKITSIKSSETYEWLLYKHYAKRIPSISYSFGLYYKSELIGICTFGIPASPSLCMGVCGEKYRDNVLELNRLCLNDHKVKNLTSYFVSNCLKLLPDNKIIVSYADTSQNHHGYIYQATNFLYTGKTKERTDIGLEDGSHSRHYNKNLDYKLYRKKRSSKYRYIIFTGTKKQKKLLKKQLKYKILEYPKGDNKRYDASYKPKTQLSLL